MLGRNHSRSAGEVRQKVLVTQHRSSQALMVLPGESVDVTDNAIAHVPPHCACGSRVVSSFHRANDFFMFVNQPRSKGTTPR